MHWDMVGMVGSGKLNVSDCVAGRNGGSGKLSIDACTGTNVLHVSVCGFAHCCGCVINGSIAKAAF